MIPNFGSLTLKGSPKDVRAVALTVLCSLALLGFFLHESEAVARYRRLKLTRPLEPADNSTDYADSPTVHLVVASIASEDVSWAYQLQVPNLQVIHYVADDPTAEYHPAANRGHEAMIYHTYFHDFYDRLPDIVIATHAQDTSWHMESLLCRSLSWAIPHLDLAAVMARGYANLRVSWMNACPDWINTTVSTYNELKVEELHMRGAFADNFPGPTEAQPPAVPEILVQPCCSQFAVTRAAIRAVPRERYAHFVRWLETAPLSDAVLGRTWEHMFQWLFAGKAVDCPVEWRAYCRMYHICFDGRDAYSAYVVLEARRAKLVNTLGVGSAAAEWHLADGPEPDVLRREIDDLSARISAMKQAAMVRGADEANRRESEEALYLD